MKSMSRRSFIKASAVCYVGLVGCQSLENSVSLTEFIPPAELRGEYELVRLACLAANSHNTQPWRFHIKPGRIVICPDYARSCPQVDPENHHLWVSIGCAMENIVQSAPGMGFLASFTLLNETVQIDLQRHPVARSSALATAIPHRQSTRCAYDGRPVPKDWLLVLKTEAQTKDVEVCLLTHEVQRKQVEALVLAANTRQLDSQAFRQELKAWLRFNEHDAQVLGDGLFSACSGNPQVPAWLGSRLFDWFYSANDAYQTLAGQLSSSSGLILLHSEGQDWRQWIEIGRSTQRLALRITSLGLKMAFINQPIEVAAIRQQLAATLNLGTRKPEILIRFGYANPMPSSFRRPLTAIVNAAI